MADEIPQSLKQADVNLYKTATRANQLSTVKPIVAYWCMCHPFYSLAVTPPGIKSNVADCLQASTGLSTRSLRGICTAPMQRPSITQQT